MLSSSARLFTLWPSTDTAAMPTRRLDEPIAAVAWSVVLLTPRPRMRLVVPPGLFVSLELAFLTVLGLINGVLELYLSL